MVRESKKSCPVELVSSGGVGMVRGKLRGIVEQPEWFSARVQVGPPIPAIQNFQSASSYAASNQPTR